MAKTFNYGRNTQVDVPVHIAEFHEDQIRCYMAAGRFNAIRCGRRWGKTALLVAIAVARAVAGMRVGIFAPSYKIINEIWHEVYEAVLPAIVSSSETKGVIYTATGGRIEFWTLEDDRAGRSRKYHTVLIDEAAFAKPNLAELWDKNIRPTLIDYEGDAWIMSTPNGVNEENFFYNICTNKEKWGFQEYHAPTRANPLMPPGEIELLQKSKAPLVFRQENEAEFVSWAGVQFFALSNLLKPDGTGFPFPTQLDAVYATIDTAVKTGQQHDGTGVIYWGVRKNFPGRKLVILDYDIVKIEGSMLEVWLPGVIKHLEVLAKRSKAILGSLGAFIEDKASGSILLQQAVRQRLPATGIDSAMTAVGKDERAVAMSGYVYRQEVEMCEEAFKRTKDYNGVHRNHLLSQVFGYQLGVKNQNDDLLDCFTYGISIGLGDGKGN